MCGIIGIVGKGPVQARLIETLKRLEYRGYDSAGVAMVADGQVGRRRARGKIRALEDVLREQPLDGLTGLTVTVLSIATLFGMMLLTGRIKWSEVLAKSEPTKSDQCQDIRSCSQHCCRSVP